MSIVSVKPIKQSKTRGKYSTYTVVWRVVSDLWNEPLNNVENATGAYYGQPLADDPTCVCNNIDTDMTDDSNNNQSFFDVTITYTNEPLGEGETGSAGAGAEAPPGEQEPNNNETPPEERYWNLSTDFVVVEKSMTEDLDGVPCLNSVGQKLPDGVVVEDYEPVVTLTGTKLLVNDSQANAEYYINTVNSTTFGGRAIGTCKCTAYKLDSSYEQGQWYWKKTFSFHVRKTGWNPIKVVDQGSLWLDPDKPDEPPQLIKDPTGNLINQIVPLRDGVPLTKDEIQDDDYSLLEFRGYDLVSWDTII